MKILIEKFKKVIPALTNNVLTEANSASFDFIRSRQNMLREFQYCLKAQNLVGVYCPLLGNGMFLVGVENIVYGEEEVLIVFYGQDMSGHQLSRRSIDIDEIRMIVPFNNPFVDPLPITIHRAQASC